MTALQGARRSDQGAVWKVLFGRVVAGTAVLLAVYGVIALMVIGSSDHLTEGNAGHALFAVGFGGLAWLAIPRQPHNKAVWVPAWAALFSGMTTAGWATAVLIGDLTGLTVSPSAWGGLNPSLVPVAAAISYEFVLPGHVASLFLMLTLWLLLFPDGEFPSPRWRWVGWGAVTILTAFAALAVWAYRPGSTFRYGAGLEGFAGFSWDFVWYPLLMFSGFSVGSLVLRYRRSLGDARQQYRWVGLGTFALYSVVWVPILLVDHQWLVGTLALVISVACYGVAVTKHRLYDIDVVISRTLVYGTLAAFIGAVYVLVVVGVGGVLGSGTGNMALALTATALVAMAFEPVRRRAQRWANRLVYGKRATPYEVLSHLTRRLAATEPAQETLTRMVDLMAEGTGAEQATVWLADRDERLTAAAGWPQLPTPREAESTDQLSGAGSPVLHDGRLVGVLEVTKARDNPVTPTERRLIADLAGSAGLVLGNQRLNAALTARAAELRESRRRLVELHDKERRHLERDLHDGAQQEIVALKLKIGLAGHLARREGAEDLAEELGELAEEAQAAVDDIRRLAKGIYPPLLESEDLTAAIKSHAATMPIPVDVVSKGIDRYPRDIESVMYFAALEAMTNGVKHGASTRMEIRLSASEEILELEVTGDGVGFDPEGWHEGTGLTNIRDRAEALGGELHIDSARETGTTVSVRLSLDVGGSADEERSLTSHRVVGGPV